MRVSYQNILCLKGAIKAHFLLKTETTTLVWCHCQRKEPPFLDYDHMNPTFKIPHGTNEAGW